MRKSATESDSWGERLERLLGAVDDLHDSVGQVVAGMRSRDAVRLLGCDTRPIYPGAPGLLSASPGVIAGINLRETAGTATVVRILDAVDAGPTPTLWSAAQILTIALPANGSLVQWMLPGGISFVYGLYVVLSGGGTVEGSVFTGTGQSGPR